MFNKKGVGEGFSWAMGLIVILIIIALAFIAYTFGHIGEKNPVTISTTDTSSSLGFNRIATYLISSDFNSSEKGKILQGFYENTQQLPSGAGLAKDYPSLSMKVLPFIVYYSPLFKFPTGFYLSCSKCPNKYLEFTYTLEAKDDVKF